jgi:hypothetical protein
VYHVKFGSNKLDVPWEAAPHFDFRALNGMKGRDAKEMLDRECDDPAADEAVKKLRDWADKHKDEDFEVSWD